MALLFRQDAAQATREVLWNASPAMRWFLYVAMVAALGVFAWGCWLRVRVWLVGKKEIRWDRPVARLGRVVRNVGLQASLLRDPIPGLIHALMFFGFVALLAATTVVFIHQDFGIHLMRGWFYLWFQSLAVNVLGFLALVGVVAAAVRRFVLRPPRLEFAHRGADAAILVAFFVILLTGFLIGGTRIAATGDPWGAWRPVSAMAGRFAASVWRTESGLRTAHAWLWMTHVTLWYAALALTPWTKMFHVVSSFANVFFGTLERESHIPRIDFEDEAAIETLGIRSPFDMTWKQLLDLEACTECGRCQDACPAFAEHKPLSPKRVILDLRDHVRARRDGLLGAAAARRAGGKEAFDAFVAGEPPLAGGVIRAESLWACTTCRACEAACPVSIEHVRLIVQLRQNLAMEQAVAPDGLVEMVDNLDTRRHPFRGVAVDRTAWYRRTPDAVRGGD